MLLISVLTNASPYNIIFLHVMQFNIIYTLTLYSYVQCYKVQSVCLVLRERFDSNLLKAVVFSLSCQVLEFIFT